MATALSDFKFSRTDNNGFRSELPSDTIQKMKAWEGNNMYQSSTFIQSRYNVRH